MEEDSDDGLVLAGGDPVMNANSALHAALSQNINPNDEDAFPGENMQLPPDIGWVQWFLAIDDHDLLLEVEKEFILDKQNLIGLKKAFPPGPARFKECLQLLLS